MRIATEMRDCARMFFSFRGRLNRASYWTMIAFFFVLYVFTVREFFDARQSSRIISSIIVIGIAMSYLSTTARRLHDRDKSGWWSIFVFGNATLQFVEGWETVPIAWVVAIPGIWLGFEIGFWRGTPHHNRFGPDPLGPRLADIDP